MAPPATSITASSSEACPIGTYFSSLSMDCEICPPGLVSTSSAATLCKPCDTGSAWANASTCLSCPPNSITAPFNPGACACTVGFYDTKYGASLLAPSCAACPLIGAVCISGFVGAKEGFWRESTLSDVFLKCREGVCLKELVVGPLSLPSNTSAVNASTHRRLLLQANIRSNATAPSNCVKGNTGPLCGLCVPGYALQSGQCLPCDPKDAFDNWSVGSRAALLVLCIIAGFVIVAFALFQPIVPSLERARAAFWAGLSAAWERVFNCCCFCLRKQASKEDGGNEPGPDLLLVHADIHTRGHTGASLAAHDEAPSADGVAAAHAHAPRRKTTELQEARQEAADHGMDTAIASGLGNAVALGIELSEDEMEEDVADAMLEGFDGLEELMEQVQRVAKILVNFYQARAYCATAVTHSRPRSLSRPSSSPWTSPGPLPLPSS